VEGRVRRFCAAGKHYGFGVAGDFNRSRPTGEVGQGQLPQFHIVFGTHDHFQLALELLGDGLELGAALRKHRLIAVEISDQGPRGGRPGLAGTHLLQIEEEAVDVLRGILAPAGQVESLPAADAASTVGNHDMIAPIGQEMHVRHGSVGGVVRARD